MGGITGITPACAGKTYTSGSPGHTSADHPRMRGEDRVVFRLVRAQDGSPPHARGRLVLSIAKIMSDRITPACAGKTPRSTLFGWPSRDHPRMRGEDTTPPTGSCSRGGSPPHARGRPRGMLDQLPDARITPACAGKTPVPSPVLNVRRDHPRMRGEDCLLFPRI